MLLPQTLQQSDPPGRGYTCLGNRLLEEWARSQDVSVSAATEIVSDACKVSRPYAVRWRQTNRPPAKYWATIQQVTGLSPTVWETWELLGREEPEIEPESAKVEKAPPRELGTTRDELRGTVQEIDLARNKGGLTPAQVATLLGKRTSALTALARLEDSTALADHPDFDALLSDVLGALERTLTQYGVDPTGARSAFAAHLEAVEAERQRRAA